MPWEENSVFVYGTLKPGGRYWPLFCEGKVRAVVPAKIRGELYDLHVGYPGMRLTDTGWVHGVVLTFERARDFYEVDELEGYDPDRAEEANEYVRRRVPCFSPEGEPWDEIWAYEVTESTLRELGGTRIPDGNWPVDGGA